MNTNKIIPIITVICVIGFTTFLLFKKETVAPTPVTNSSSQAVNTRTLTLKEVAKHNTKTDCYIVINNSVIDATAYIASGKHNPEIVRGCGLDATVMFEAERKHTKGEAQTLLTELSIGTISK